MDIQHKIEEKLLALGEAHEVWAEAMRAVAAIRPEYKLAFAAAYTKAEGTEKLRMAQAEIQTADLFARKEALEAEERIWRSAIEAYRQEVSAMQSVLSALTRTGSTVEWA